MAAPYTFDSISSNFEQIAASEYQNFSIPLPYNPIMITHVGISIDQTSTGNGLYYYLGSVSAEGAANPNYFAAHTTGDRLINTNVINPVTEDFPIWVTDPYLVLRTNTVIGANISIQVSTRNFDNDFINVTGLQSNVGKLNNGTPAGNVTVASSSSSRIHLKSLYLVGSNVGTPIYVSIQNGVIVEPIPVAITGSTEISPNCVLTSPFNMGSNARTDNLNLYFDAALTSDLYYYSTFSVVS